MRKEPNLPNNECPDAEGVSRRTTLLRGFADGELSDAEVAELQQHLEAYPADRAVIEQERRLREAIAQGEAGKAPALLREQIERIRQDAQAGGAEPLVLQRTIAQRGGWRFRRTLVVGLAASLVMAIGLIALTRPAPLPVQGEVINAAHRSSVLKFVSAQHGECELYAKLVAERFTIGPVSAAPSELAKILGIAPSLGDLAAGASSPAGVEYLGAARCAVPGRGDSVHVVLAVGGVVPDAAGRASLVSLFVQEDRDELLIERGRTYFMTSKTGEWTGVPMSILVWRKDGLIYFLVGTTSDKLEAARIELGAAAPMGQL
jgi:hypothetical protein